MTASQGAERGEVPAGFVLQFFQVFITSQDVPRICKMQGGLGRGYFEFNGSQLIV